MVGQKAQKNLLFAAVLTGVLVIVLMAMYFYIASKEQKREAPDTLLTFTGIPANAQMKATLTMAGRAADLAVGDDSVALTPELRKDFKLPYILQTTIRSGDSYRDLSWRIDKRGAEYYILADGFSPNDKITLLINDRPVFTIPFDWSGRIELPIIALVAEDTKACINIVEAKETLAFCHFLTGKKAA
jgi:hypothetical protein